MSDLTKSEFLFKLLELPARPLNINLLLKQLGGALVKNRAVWVATSQLDLDTDGARNPGVEYESTHQNETSLCWPGGRAVNADVTPYVVIPLQWGEKVGIKLGDIGLACIAGCDEVVPVIVADKGKPDKIGEGSIKLHREFGHETVVHDQIVNAGIVKSFHMLLFKDSSLGHCIPNDEISQRAWTAWNNLIKA